MIFIPLTPLATAKTKTKWIYSCPSCQQEKIVTSSQMWNISTNKCSGKCKWCVKGWDRAKQVLQTKDNRSLFVFYRNLFDNPTKYKEVRLKQRMAKLGKYKEHSNNWQGGKSSARHEVMSKDVYKQLRRSVFIRDKFTCQICETKGGRLEMDHIKEWRNYPELRLEPLNCRTLCKSCHKNTDNYGHKALKKSEVLHVIRV